MLLDSLPVFCDPCEDHNWWSSVTPAPAPAPEGSLASLERVSITIRQKKTFWVSLSL